MYVYEDSAAEKYFADTYMNYKIIPELSKAQAYADENGIIPVSYTHLDVYKRHI